MTKERILISEFHHEYFKEKMKFLFLGLLILIAQIVLFYLLNLKLYLIEGNIQQKFISIFLLILTTPAYLFCFIMFYRRKQFLISEKGIQLGNKHIFDKPFKLDFIEFSNIIKIRIEQFFYDGTLLYNKIHISTKPGKKIIFTDDGMNLTIHNDINSIKNKISPIIQILKSIIPDKVEIKKTHIK